MVVWNVLLQDLQQPPHIREAACPERYARQFSTACASWQPACLEAAAQAGMWRSQELGRMLRTKDRHQRCYSASGEVDMQCMHPQHLLRLQPLYVSWRLLVVAVQSNVLPLLQGVVHM
jgi:hypothetical protein